MNTLRSSTFLPLALLLAWLWPPAASAAKTAPAASLPQVSTGRIERLPAFPARHVPSRPIDVWLPDGYPDAGRYDVLYMHDGQMLFDAAQTWNHQEWRADETAGALIAAGKTRPFIIVGIWNIGAARHSEYFPQKPWESLPRAQRRTLLEVNRDAETPLFARGVYSDRYLKFIVRQLKPYIDTHYAVQPGPEHTFVLGSSMGGLISFYALAEYPDVFGGAACLSTHWPGTFAVDDNPIPGAFLAYLGTHLPVADRHRLYFDYGTATLDALYPPLQARVDALMRAKDYPPHLWQTRRFEGAEHSEPAWAARLDVPLQFLLAP